MGEAAMTGRWDDWLNIKAMGIPCMVAVSVTLAVVIAAMMTGFILLTLRRARRRGDLPVKVSPFRNGPAPTDTPPPPANHGHANRSLG